MVYANRYRNVTVTDVMGVERRDEQSVRPRCIIAFLESQGSSDDLALPWLPRKWRADKDGAFRDEPTAAHAVAGGHPKGHEQVMLDFALREKTAESARSLAHQSDAAP